MLLKFYHFGDGKAYFNFSIYKFILSEIKLETDKIYPIMPSKFEREDIEDTSKYILAISTSKKIGFFNTDDVFRLSITLFYELNYFTKIQTKNTAIRGTVTETSTLFVRRFDIEKDKDKYGFWNKL